MLFIIFWLPCFSSWEVSWEVSCQTYCCTFEGNFYLPPPPLCLFLQFFSLALASNSFIMICPSMMWQVSCLKVHETYWICALMFLTLVLENSWPLYCWISLLLYSLSYFDYNLLTILDLFIFCISNLSVLYFPSSMLHSGYWLLIYNSANSLFSYV